MFALRRAALRIAVQPSRSLSSTSQSFVSRAPRNLLERPTLHRCFHQSWTQLADEGQKTPAEQAEPSPAEAESASETVTTEPNPAEQQAEIKEESVATPEVADAAANSSPTTSHSVGATEQVQGIASRAADVVQQTTSRVARTARDAVGSFGSNSRDIQPSKILYIGNLFFEVTAAQLEAEFSRLGDITNTRVVTDNQGMSKGFGYVEFASQDSAERAIADLNQKVFHGRRMVVQYHVRREPRNIPASGRPQQPQSPTKTLFIGNMSYQMSDRDLNDLFREIRDVLDVRVAIDRRSGQPRGFAHADFLNVEAATRAKAHLEQKTVYGRQLRVDYSNSSTQPRQPSD